MSAFRNDVDRELEFHLEMQTRRYIEAGLTPDAARAKALERMGDLRAAARQSRAIAEERNFTVRQTRWLQALIQDIRYASRALRRTPVFSATALLTLAVGIGATTAIFSVVNAVLLGALPYPNAERILVFYNSYPQTGLEQAATAPEELADVKAQAQAFDRIAGIRPQISALTDDCLNADCEPERVNAYAVSPELFDLLGVKPQTGRSFAAADGVAGAARVVVLTDALWRRRYDADPAIIGRTIHLAGLAWTVVGVMPAGMRFPDEPVGYLTDPADIWIPVNWQDVKDGRGNQYLVTLASIKPALSRSQAEADLQRIGDGFKARFPDRYAKPEGAWRLGSASLVEQMIGDVRLGLIVLFGAVTCVLLIACANVANLMLARGVSRRRELAVRSALGASRGRLVSQLLVETLTLTGAGTVIGLGVAAGGLKLLLALNPGNLPRVGEARIDTTVLLFASALALVTSVAVGLIPALRQSRTDPQIALADGSRGLDSSSPRRRLRGALVMAEVAVAVVVLTGATLLIRSFIAMAHVPVGVTGTNVAIARLSIPRATYDEPAKIYAFNRGMRDRLAAMPGVTQASAVYPLPMSGSGWSGTVGIVGRPTSDTVPEPHAEYAVALPGYYSTVGIPLLEGRDFADTDTAAAPLVAIVDMEFARQYWPGQSAIGQRISTSGNMETGPFRTVVGVVEHVRNKGARESGEGQLYLPAFQVPEVSLFFLARTNGNPSSVLPSIRGAVREQDAKLPIAALTTMGDLLSTFTARERFNMLLFIIFGGVALAIAAIGLYGVLAFLVTQRTRELGIRLALGGTPGGLVRGVLLEGLALTSAGLLAGLVTAALLGRTMKELLFEIEPSDPVTYAVISGVMIAVALLASIGPARRAAGAQIPR